MGVFRQMIQRGLEKLGLAISFFDSLNNFLLREVSKSEQDYDSQNEETPQETFNRVNSHDRKQNIGDKEVTP